MYAVHVCVCVKEEEEAGSASKVTYLSLVSGLILEDRCGLHLKTSAQLLAGEGFPMSHSNDIVAWEPLQLRTWWEKKAGST